MGMGLQVGEELIKRHLKSEERRRFEEGCLRFGEGRRILSALSYLWEGRAKKAKDP